LRLGDGSSREMLSIGAKAVENSIMFKTGQAFFKPGYNYFNNNKPSMADSNLP
tara:strand:+ start:94 stop:252 length:159 start_codon:yes stop_codon:yes gene_type:complete